MMAVQTVLHFWSTFCLYSYEADFMQGSLNKKYGDFVDRIYHIERRKLPPPTVLIFAWFIKCIDATQILNTCQRGAGTDYPSGAYELISGFSGVRVIRSLVCCVCIAYTLRL
jgi:hypothetical protein